jgi:hypothetical protein
MVHPQESVLQRGGRRFSLGIAEAAPQDRAHENSHASSHVACRPENCTLKEIYRFGSFTIAYTSDGGKRWNTMEVRLPAGINASSLPARDRGYVVGDHGMVYRYRIVPIDYSAKA